ncbi:hypothetical protein ACVW17_006920 [Bradyrhizobium sp. USDA 4473]
MANSNDFDICALKRCGQGWMESHAHASPRYLLCHAPGWCRDAGGERRGRPTTRSTRKRWSLSSGGTSGRAAGDDAACRADGPRRPARDGETACNGSATSDGSTGRTCLPCRAATGDGGAPGTAFRRSVGTPGSSYRRAARRNAPTRISSQRPVAAPCSPHGRAITPEPAGARERAALAGRANSTACAAAAAAHPAAPAGRAAAAA